MPTRYPRWRAVCCTAALACTTAWADPADGQPRLLTFAKDTPLPVSLTLSAAQGKVGRERPIYNGYRPQLRFAGAPPEVTCALTLPPPRDKVEPGETADLTATCPDTLKLRDDRLDFTVHEGGRQVGRGRLQAGN